MFDLFFKATGLITRKPFWIGVVGLFIFVEVINFTLRALNNNALGFSIALVFPFLVGYMIYCVYGKRLHDMGRSWWPITAAIVAEILIMIAVMMAYGGAEYFAGFAQYERKAVIDEAVRQALITDYQTEIAAHTNIIRVWFLIVPVALTLWLGTAESKVENNKYRKLPQ